MRQIPSYPPSSPRYCRYSSSLVPRLLVGGEKRAWYLLFAHARNYPLLNTCLDKSGRGRRILIHVIDSVTHKFYQVYLYSRVQRRAKQPHYSLNYTALIRYKFLLTYGSMTNGNTGITRTYQGVAV